MLMCYNLYAPAVNGVEIVSRGGDGCVTWSSRINLMGIISSVDTRTKTECDTNQTNRIRNDCGVNFTMQCVGRGPSWCTGWSAHP